MKITSLFSRVSSHGPSESVAAGNDDGDNRTPKSKLLPSSVSSPDIIPPSPVLEKKKSVKARRSLNPTLVVDGSNEQGRAIVSRTDSVSVSPKKTLDLRSPTKSTIDDRCVDSQSCSTGPETISQASTVYDETDFCSDLTFDDWDDCSPSISKYLTLYLC